MRRNYSNYLNDFCTTYRLSGAQVARMVGMAEETIQAIRRGERKPQQATKDKLNRFILNYKKENQPITPITSQETQTDIVGIDSRTVAEWTEKEHKSLMRDIRQYTEFLKGTDLCSTDFWQEMQYYFDAITLLSREEFKYILKNKFLATDKLSNLRLQYDLQIGETTFYTWYEQALLEFAEAYKNGKILSELGVL